MHLFYSQDLQPRINYLGEDESHHCARVLRLSEGEHIQVTDGTGHFAEGVLRGIHDKKCSFILESLPDPLPFPSPLIHIAMAPTKSSERFEWFLEKSTEIGISQITPVICRHSERLRLNLVHARKVLIAAMKQSLQAYLPLLEEPVPFRDFIKQGHSGQKFIAWCESEGRELLSSVYKPGSDATILIGPEGDFSEEEVELSKKAGFIPVSLGENRLRTETAGMVSLMTLSLLNQCRK
ncbi:MAG: 16S rRNA (uracil(1498)-N(3))-methyltransferase [Bacteroidota bacterium]|nr:16S rRNA (uracil(1498)-N(3))-methyltransferase [Bacteroidota bacterium]